ncbi:MAG TPA: autotransporter, partial [Variovorax sp.]|nr:autotransporter [Variovorax sp.]
MQSSQRHHGWRWMKAVAAFACATATICSPFAASAAPTAQTGAAASQPGSESPWPYTVRLNAKDMLQVYPPQVDSWDGLQLLARAAVVMREGATGSADTGKDSRATYGVIELAARTLVDKGTRRVTLDQYAVTKAQFPTAGQEAQAWVDALQKDAVGKSRVISLDRLEAQVQGVQAAERNARLPLKNEVPSIIFSRNPAILVSVDGAPRYARAEGTSLERVLNTRVLLLRDGSGRHYLHVFDGWMTADSLQGPGGWSVLAAESADLKKVRTEAEKNRASDLLSGVTAATSDKAGDARQAPPTLKNSTPPRIYVATQPTELVVSDGDWMWTPVAGTPLMYVKNTTG